MDAKTLKALKLSTRMTEALTNTVRGYKGERLRGDVKTNTVVALIDRGLALTDGNGMHYLTELGREVRDALLGKPKPEVKTERYEVREHPSRSGFEVFDTQAGRIVNERLIGSRYAANEMAERMNTQAAKWCDPSETIQAAIDETRTAIITPNHLHGVIHDIADDHALSTLDLPAANQRPGRWAVTALSGQDAPDGGVKLVQTLGDAAREFPMGTRVEGPDTLGHTRQGVVNGSVGVVSYLSHPNFGRTYVEVAWDETGIGAEPRHMLRGRPFTDSLRKL